MKSKIQGFPFQMAVMKVLYFMNLFLIKETHSKATVASYTDLDYTGPEPCPKSNEDVQGYTDLNTLNQDMYLDAIDVLSKNQAPKDVYAYVICPHTTLDIDQTSEETGIHESLLIYLNNTILRCGDYEEENESESVAGSCVIKGGDVQIIFAPELEVRNVLIKGITFTNNRGFGIAAFGHPRSDVVIMECHWVENDGVYAVLQYYQPSAEDDSKGDGRNRALKENERYFQIRNRFYLEGWSVHKSETRELLKSAESHAVARKLPAFDAMSVHFHRCTFTDNVYDGEVLHNQGGDLQLLETKFVNNIVNYAVVGVVYGGELYLEQDTHFQDNISPFVPVFVDNDSFLNLNVDNTGENNLGMVCLDGVFLESEDSECTSGGKCDGECCLFGDESCDRFIAPNQDFSKEAAPEPSENIEEASSASSSGKDEKEFGMPSLTAPKEATVYYNDKKTVNRLYVLVGLLSSALVFMTGLFICKKKREHARLGTEPDNAFDDVRVERVFELS